MNDKTKIAILIGVSNYENLSSLHPACKNDVELVHEIIKNTKNYEEQNILVLQDKKAFEAKESIANFINTHKVYDISEVFFYYTGHGKQDNNEFSFLFSDYKSENENTTSLKNTELDLILKSLNPKLTVKIIDACHSGLQYIKNSDKNQIQNIFGSSTKSYEKLYFMFSSHDFEYSIAGADFSDFTKSFAKAIFVHKSNEILYSDIINFIKDDFESNQEQHPFFVTQASHTDFFCIISDDMRTLIKEKVYGGETLQLDKVGIDDFNKKLLDNIKTKSENVCSKHEAHESLDYLVSLIEKKENDFDPFINEIYNIKLEKTIDFNDILGINKIAEWVKNKSEQYFVEVQYEDEEYETIKKVTYQEDLYPFAPSSWGKKQYTEEKPVIQYRKVPKTIKLTAKYDEKDFLAFILALSPKEKILEYRKIFIVFIFSKKILTLFGKVEKEKDIDWERQETQNESQWVIKSCSLKQKSDIEKSLEDIFSSLKEKIISDISSEHSK